ncbi:hypothetical protein ACFGVR_10460 [Mucilaginibacter sp. AW1-3]
MSANLLYFIAMLLLSAGYVYNHFVLVPKIKSLNNAHHFRQARNLNTELINLLSHYGQDLQDCLFDGDNYETTMANLQILQSNVYTTDTFKQLVGRQKVKRRHIEAIKASIDQQISMQLKIKVSFNVAMSRYKKSIAA